MTFVFLIKCLSDNSVKFWIKLFFRRFWNENKYFFIQHNNITFTYSQIRHIRHKWHFEFAKRIGDTTRSMNFAKKIKSNLIYIYQIPLIHSSIKRSLEPLKRFAWEFVHRFHLPLRCSLRNGFNRFAFWTERGKSKAKKLQMRKSVSLSSVLIIWLEWLQ